MNNYNIALATVVILLTSFMFMSTCRKTKKEGFEAVGLIYNKPPEWFNKPEYKVADWIVTYNPDQLEKPECMHYRGNPKELNYLSSAYRFWRM